LLFEQSTQRREEPHFDHHWCLPSKIDDSSLTWMITFNGFIIDARSLPREIQEVAYKKGIIPYIHADR